MIDPGNSLLASQPPGEPMLTLLGPVCSGCGERPELLHPVDAIASLRLLERRSMVLVRHGCHNPSQGGDPQPPAAWSAPESAARISTVLAVADRRLRRLLGEDQQHRTDHAGTALSFDAPRSVPASTPNAGLMSVADSAERMVQTIAGVTPEDWYRRRRGAGVSAAEVAWLAVHEAVHHLEDAELSMG